MQKKVLLGGIVGVVLAAGVGVYHYVNYQASTVLVEQIAVINQSYAAMAADGLMPGVVLSYQQVQANYWRNDYQIKGLAINVAGLGVLAEVAGIRVKGFKPGTLSDWGAVSVNGVKLARGMQILLPPALAELSAELELNTDYQYQYQSSTGELLLKQQLQLGKQFSLQYQVTLQQMQPLWQFASALHAMDAPSQQRYSQSAEYGNTLSEALAQGALQQGSLELNNSGFLQALHSALEASAQTAQLSGLKLQLEQYLHSNTELPEAVLQPLQAFLAEPRYIKLAFRLTEPLRFAQLEDEAFMEQLQTPEQLIQFSHLQLTVNP